MMTTPFVLADLAKGQMSHRESWGQPQMTVDSCGNSTRLSGSCATAAVPRTGSGTVGWISWQLSTSSKPCSSTRTVACGARRKGPRGWGQITWLLAHSSNSTNAGGTSSAGIPYPAVQGEPPHQLRPLRGEILHFK